MSAIDRFQLSALVDRLIYGSEDTFAREDAIALLAMIPDEMRHQGSWLSIGAKFDSSAGAMQGAAAGVGNVSMQTDKSSAVSFDSTGRKVVRSGQWKIRVVRNELYIEQVMSDDFDEARTARIRYLAGEPIVMEILTQSSIDLFVFEFVWGTFKPWKRVRAE